MISFFICAASVRNPSALGDRAPTVRDRCVFPWPYAAKLEWRRAQPMSLDSCQFAGFLLWPESTIL
jgi:hypothetical protein